MEKVPPAEGLTVLHGDLVRAPGVDAIVNAWNRNIIPWWLLLPSGVSRSIKREAGREPFLELGRRGPIPLGGAVATGPGRLPYKAILHVAGINMAWRSSPAVVRQATVSALDLARDLGLRSLAFPLVGAGTGGVDPEIALETMTEAIKSHAEGLAVVVVRYRASG